MRHVNGKFEHMPSIRVSTATGSGRFLSLSLAVVGRCPCSRVGSAFCCRLPTTGGVLENVVLWFGTCGNLLGLGGHGVAVGLLVVEVCARRSLTDLDVLNRTIATLIPI